MISVYDGIASQIYILVLNASDEAARAFQLGRGIALMVAEVRQLPQYSADAVVTDI